MIKSFFLQFIAINRDSTLNGFAKVTPENVGNRLTPECASVGFLYRHMGDAIHGLVRGPFGMDMDFRAVTFRVESDEGLCNDIDETRRILETGFEKLLHIVVSMEDADWDTEVETIMGKMTKGILLGRLLMHNSYHHGQAQLSLKKGSFFIIEN